MENENLVPNVTPLPVQPQPQPQSISGEKNEGTIYRTTFKKGFVISHIHFKFAGPLDSAVKAVKEYLALRHLKHLHTVPFLIDITVKTEDEEFPIFPSLRDSSLS